MEIEHDVVYTQAKGARLCLHFGTTAYYFGCSARRGLRIELCTPKRWLRLALLST